MHQRDGPADQLSCELYSERSAVWLKGVISLARIVRDNEGKDGGKSRRPIPNSNITAAYRQATSPRVELS